MRAPLHCLRALLPLCLLAPALGQGSDDCAAPSLISGLGSWTWDNATATTSGFDGGDPGVCFSPSNPAYDDGPYQDLFWTWTAAADGAVVFDTEGSTGNLDTKLSLHAGSDCSASCVASDDDSGASPLYSSRVVLEGVLAGEDYLVQLGSWSPTSEAGAGVLNISNDACSLVAPDALEDNDDCLEPTNLTNGAYLDLNVSKTDWDYYRVLVPFGGTLDAVLSFNHLEGDIDAYLYDEAGVCHGFADGDVGANAALASSESFSNDEAISWTNNSGGARYVILKVYVWPGTFTSDCNDYSLLISGAFDSAPGIFCDPAQDHSAGGAVDLSTSCVCGPQIYHLEALGGPPGEFGFFLVAASQSAPGLPVGDGLLCLQLPIGRYDGNAGGQRNSLGQFDAAGTLQNLTGNSASGSGFDVPLQLPFPPGGSIQPGESWSFQLWYRDGLSSNISNGISVQF